MKTQPITILTLLFSCLAGQATVTITGDLMNIGISNTISQNNNAVIGYSNYVSQPASLAIGKFNTLEQDDNDYGSFALGHHNYIHGYGSIVGGSYNTVLDDSSVTTGYYNYNNAPSSLVVGTGNVAE